MISSTNLDQVPPEQFRTFAERGMQLLSGQLYLRAVPRTGPEKPALMQATGR